MSRQAAPLSVSAELYAGIEVGADDVKAVALRVSQSEGESGFKLVYSEIVRLALQRTSSGQFAPQASAEAAQAILKLLTRLRQQYQVPPEHIHLIGSSRLRADHPEDLVGVISKTTGQTLTFLDAVTEVQLSIAGTIPRLAKTGDVWVDNRNSSVLIDVGSFGVQGGYELLRYLPSDSPVFDFVAMSLPHGAMSYANEVSRTVGENKDLSVFIRGVRASNSAPLRQALRSELERKPGMVNRKRVFLTGGIVWAMATLLYPEDRQALVPLTYENIAQFADKATRTPEALINPNLASIRDRKLRQEVGQEMEAIKGMFTSRQLIAGAELLKAMAEELKWQEKKIWFARLGHLGCILSYVRLQTGK
ncbi:MAG: hypothetical protein ACREEM_32785 [Blastocatellia bacterium]